MRRLFWGLGLLVAGGLLAGAGDAAAAATITHSKVCSQAATGSSTDVDCPDWNANHVLTGTLDVANGGTGVATLTGLALGNGAAAFSAYGGTSCSAGNAIRVLSASGVATTCEPTGGSHALLSATHTDTTPATVLRGALVTGQGASPTWSLLALGSAGKLIRSDGTDAGWSTTTWPNAATTGDLLAATGANAYGNIAAVATGSYLRSAGTSTLPVWSTLTLPNAATTGDLFAATGSNAMGAVAAVASGQVLASRGTGTLPAWDSKVVLTQGTLASGSVPALDHTATWNNAGTTFTNIKSVVTDTASAAASLLLDLQAGASPSTKFNIKKDGTTFTAAAGTGAAPAIAVTEAALGLYNVASGHLGIASQGLGRLAVADQVYLRGDQSFGWEAGGCGALGCSGGADVKLFRDAANVLGQRNSTSAQGLKVYNTWTDASNYERFAIQWASNIVTLGTEQAGTGTARALALDFNGNAIAFKRAGTAQLTVTHGASSTGLQIRTGQQTAPTCTTNCGTSPSVAGSDTAGRVTMGSSGSPASGWVVTFNGTWANAPRCTVWMSKSGMVTGKKPIVVVTSTTTFTVTTDGTAPATTDTYDYHCIEGS
jgi:hypothetical protein